VANGPEGIKVERSTLNAFFGRKVANLLPLTISGMGIELSIIVLLSKRTLANP
jgi:hypothetical protein